LSKEQGSPEREHRRHIQGAAVIALWGSAAAWIGIAEALCPAHRTETLQWRGGVGLILATAAGAASIIWALTRHRAPADDFLHGTHLGYRAGYADGQADREPGQLYQFPAPTDQRAHANGKH
jgi:hypothetical protein